MSQTKLVFLFCFELLLLFKDQSFPMQFFGSSSAEEDGLRTGDLLISRGTHLQCRSPVSPVIDLELRLLTW